MLQTSPPLVSILIRSMDRPTLERALESAAAQSWQNLEIVVVAASGHAHRALPTKFQGRPLRLILAAEDRRLTRPEAANLALDAARGEWLNFLDDDDELRPAHIATLLAAARPNGERLIYARTAVIDESGREIGHCNLPGYHLQLFYQNRTTTCATLIQRSLIDEGARFDAAFPVYEDHDFFIACAARTPFLFVDAATSVWHAFAGESGCGQGPNDNVAQRDEYRIKLRLKWQQQFDLWWQDADALLFTGQYYLQENDLVIALDCLERALNYRPFDINALNLCGMANLRAGKFERAELLLGMALDRLPGHAGLQRNLELLRRTRAEQPAADQQR